MGFGGAALGELWGKVTEQEAQAMLRAAYDGGTRFFDTAPWYGFGLSEVRLGGFLRQVERSGVQVNTKVGRTLRYHGPGHDNLMWAGGLPFDVTFDYSGDGIKRSVEDSTQRLSTFPDFLTLHDIDPGYHGDREGVEARIRECVEGGGFAYLKDLKDQGLIKGIGAGLNELTFVPDLVANMDLDFFVVGGRLTLLENPAPTVPERDAVADFLDLCTERGMTLLAGGVFASGILATGVHRDAKYDYADASGPILLRTAKLQSVCNDHGVDLAEAALQYTLLYPQVRQVIPGADSADMARQNVARLNAPVPAALWQELEEKGLAFLPPGADLERLQAPGVDYFDR